MQHLKSQIGRSGQLAAQAARFSAALLLCGLAGCGGGTAKQTTATAASPQTYFAPLVAGTTYSSTTNSSTPITHVALSSPQTYTIDDVGTAFYQTTYQALIQPGPQVLNAGTLTVSQRGLRSLDIMTNYVDNTGASPAAFEPYQPSTSEAGFAVELAGQAGGLVQLFQQPVAPIVAATECPSLSSPRTYQFITIPAALTSSDTAQYTWNSTTDTAYGSVDITSSGSAVIFQNIQQYTVGGTRPAQPSATTVTGVCGPTVFGSLTGIPGQYVVSDPELNSKVPPQATVSIGPTGLLVEDNGDGANGTLAGTSPSLYYDNVLGAGTGAVGLPKPSSALDTAALVGAQYLGFIYAAGAKNPAVTWSSNLASFGFSGAPASCSAGLPLNTPSTPAVIDGGDFSGGGPSSSSNGYGQCDFAIDLGPTQTDNGLYTGATVYVGKGYNDNTSVAATYSFHAVAIAGQLGGKYAIFLIGMDPISNQPWAIYLLQSN